MGCRQNGHRVNRYDVHVVQGKPQKFKAQTMLASEALRRGVSVKRTNRVDLSLIPVHGEPAMFHKSRPRRTPNSTVRLAKDKTAARTSFSKAGLPIADGRAFPAARMVEAVAYVRSMGFPVVVKPNNGRQGIAVTANIRTIEELQLAIQRIQQSVYHDGEFLVERYIPGRDFRIFATRDRTISVIERIPAAVVGDGSSTIQELVEAKNLARRLNPYFMSKPLDLANEPALLREQGYTPDSVPPAGEMITLSSVANISRGGESVDLTSQTHDTLKSLAVACVNALPSLEYAGVDIIAPDPAAPVSEQQVAVIEVNGTPDILMHPFPAYGEPQNVPAAIVRSVLSLNDDGEHLRADSGPVTVRVSGDVTGVGFRKWVRRQCRRLGLSCDVRNEDAMVVAEIEGKYERVAMFVDRCRKGPERASVREVTATPAPIASRPGRSPEGGATNPRLRSAMSLERVADSQPPARDGQNRDIVDYIHALDGDRIPTEVVHRAKLLILDTLGTVLLGAADPSTASASSAATSLFPGSEATIFGAQRCASPGAAFANACFAQVHDFNDGHAVAARHGGSSHPGRVVVPAALAEAERAGASGLDLLIAVVMGYDVACKVLAPKYIDGVKIQPSSYYAAAAVASRLRGLSPDKTASALGLAGYASPSKHSLSVPGVSTNALANGFRSRVGIEAAVAAEAGLRGPYIKDDVERSLRFYDTGLGLDFEVMRTYVKPYPSCRMTHSPIDAAIELVTTHDISPQDVSAIHVEQLPKGMYVARKRPRSLRSYKKAQFSLHYCVARAVIDRRVTIDQFDSASLEDPDVFAMMGKITVEPNKDLGANFPESERPAIVHITTTRGATHSCRIDVPLGDPGNFLPEQVIREKFMMNARRLVSQAAAEELVDFAMHLEHHGSVSLISRLATSDSRR
jgi:2-methylcitrate dehydratase PrpD/D-alanine-D-alanine ligase-like ATP-grasp enzyme/acylphosphatase